MNPEAVLTNDQKKLRFRNTLKKKTAKRPHSNSADEEELDVEDEIDEGFAETSGTSETQVFANVEDSPASSSKSEVFEKSEPSPKLAKTTPEERSETSESADYQPSVESSPRESKTESPSPSNLVCVQRSSPENADFVFESGIGPFSYLLDDAKDPPCPIGASRVLKKIECFKLSNEQLNFKSDFIDELISYHRGECLLTHQSFCDFLTTMGSQFRHMALMNLDFCQLSLGDQRKLLARNTPLFIQYVLARYFTAETGYEQLSWLLGFHTPKMSTKEQSFIKKISLKRANQHLNLFHFGAYLDTYREFAQRLNVRTLRYKCTAIWCHIILYQTDHSMTLDNKQLVERLCEDSLKICAHSGYMFQCTEKPNIPGMLFSAEAMARFFAQNFIWEISVNGQKDSNPTSPIASTSSGSPTNVTNSPESFVPYLKYGQEEEIWLQNQLNKFERAWKSVPIGEDMIHEFVMFSYDVPLGKFFLPQTLSIFSQRYLHIMKMHPEFENLKKSDQDHLWKNNSIFGSAMSVAKLESMEDGLEQHRFVTSEVDDLTWMGKIAYQRKLKKLSVTSINQASGALNETLLSNLMRLAENIGALIQNPESFKLFALVLLFSESDDIPAIRDLRNYYLNIIRRRHNMLYNEDVPEEDNIKSIASGNMVYSRFNSCICDVKELAMILRKFTE